MIERNKYKYAKERDEYIKILEKPIRFTRGEVMSWFSFSLEKEIHKQCFQLIGARIEDHKLLK